jgi:hypothetical protein
MWVLKLSKHNFLYRHLPYALHRPTFPGKPARVVRKVLFGMPGNRSRFVSLRAPFHETQNTLKPAASLLRSVFDL